MLVLTRKLSEKIMIGNDTQIKILRLDANRVVLGIDAPKNVTVHRQEIFNKIRRRGRVANDFYSRTGNSL